MEFIVRLLLRWKSFEEVRVRDIIMGKLFVIGASGHGKVVADIALKSKKYDDIVFLDDNEELEIIMGLPVVGKTDQYDLINKDKDEVIVAIGNAQIRCKFQKKYEERGINIATLIHPDAIIAQNVVVHSGTVVMGGAVINPDVKIGKGCIINTSASVDHDCIIKDFVHVSVGVHMAGNVLIGSKTWIGIGSIISNNVYICDECVIGAGTVVIHKIEEQGTYIGNPARKLR